VAMEQPKTIIVTGGASGIGYAFCEHLGQLGHLFTDGETVQHGDAAPRVMRLFAITATQ
jgi:NAD(P)-dependent dehydrogenase (short-subunit alcohol dehydrogenase family)